MCAKRLKPVSGPVPEGSRVYGKQVLPSDQVPYSQMPPSVRQRAGTTGFDARYAAGEGILTESKGGHLIHCPSCTRYIGPSTQCPFCGFKIPKKVSYTALKRAVLIWSVVGVLLLQQIYSHVDNPEAMIGDLGPRNNYGMFIIEGTVTRSPTYYDSDTKEFGTMYLNVDDGTGEIQVITYDETTTKMVKDGYIVPAFGDTVRVEGTYYYKDYRTQFICNTPQHMHVIRQEPYETTIAFIDNSIEEAGLTNQRVTVEGYVQTWDMYDWALSLWITDNEGHDANVYVPDVVWKLTGDGELFSLEVGQHVRATGALLWYESGSYSRWEIIPATSAEFVILEEVV